MNLLKTLSIGKKIAIITGVSVASFVVLLSVISTNVSDNSERLSELKERLYPILQEAQSSVVAVNLVAEGLRTAVMIGEEDMLEGADEQMAALKASLEVLNGYGADSKALADISRNLNSYFNSARALAFGMIEGTVSMEQMASQAAASNAVLEKLQNQLIEFRSQAQMAVDERVEQANQASQWTLGFSISLGVATVILILLIGWSVSANITKGIRQVSRSLEEIASGDGDLTVRVNYDGKDELADLVSYFNQFVDKLQGLIRQTVDSASSLGDMAEQLSRVSAQANANIASQTNAIDQTTGALNEMFVSVGHIAEHAAEASNSASQASGDSSQGLTLMEASVGSINELAVEVEKTAGEISRLESYTSNVGSILDTIRGIAEQTNLLALNAAIEAARAGEQGRGFAVVADEVRSLASRTQDSTQEIQQVLEELQNASKSAVESMSRGTDMASHSVEQAEHTGTSLNSITNQVEAISGLNDQIAAATEEQNQTSELIRTYVEEIQLMAQDAMSSTSELEGVSQSLVDVNEQLSQVVNQFKV
ncbi:methyl-accepting chemotaxis protein [Corallincola luteus]|uniref:Methyl-accepting chemotaxis protein n=1 Tax=Corallincola luteus TaxID=1775177 RepID=A0ABY2ARC9_9GAMM|nr:methyl-accepting chemotaxis protein [Corallincola luteus]TCI04948.1 methyl-accepting chemotaxis protein [Corallincola luteus]